MTPRARRLIRWASIIVFLIAAPAIILSTAGYRYNQAKGKIERTGVLIVDSQPSGASISLNGSLRGEKTPSDVIRLLPGDYTVRVDKPGYKPWQKSVSVQADETTFLSDIVLFRDELPLFEQEAQSSVSAFSADGRRLAVFIKSARWSEVRVFDLKTGASWLPYRASSAADASLDWSPDGRRLLITAPSIPRTSYVVWDSASPEDLLSLADISTKPFRQAFWSDDGATLYAADVTTLYAIDLQSHEAQASGPAADGMTVYGGTVYGFSPQEDGVVLVRRLLREQSFSAETAVPKSDYRRIPGDGKLLAFLSPSGGLLIVDPADTKTGAVFASGSASGGVWSDDGKSLLYWSDLELHVFDAGSGADDLLTRLGSELHRAAWYPDGRLALFASDTGFWVIDAGHDDNRTATQLAEYRALTDFSIDKTGSAATLIGTIGRQTGIWSLNLK